MNRFAKGCFTIFFTIVILYVLFYYPGFRTQTSDWNPPPYTPHGQCNANGQCCSAEYPYLHSDGRCYTQPESGSEGGSSFSFTGTYTMNIGFYGPGGNYETHSGSVQLNGGCFTNYFSGCLDSNGFTGACPQSSNAAQATFSLDTSGRAQGKYYCQGAAAGQEGNWWLTN
jgi:hypothetical protein